MRKSDLKGDLNLTQLIPHEMWYYNYLKSRFPYHGVIAFDGSQGSGKTLSAVRMVSNILNDYPDTLLVTNIDLNFEILTHINPYNVIQFQRYYQIFINYGRPVIFLLDEGHLLFNSLLSKDTDISMFQVISQNRKNQRVFILTTQVFNRLEKVMREQVNTVVHCRTFFNYFTRCCAIGDFRRIGDELVGRKLFATWFAHDRKIHYKMYDTYQVIDFNRDSPFWNSETTDKVNGSYYEIIKSIGQRLEDEIKERDDFDENIEKNENKENFDTIVINSV